MEKTEALVDTGLIVGLLHKRDQHHEWAKQQFARLSAPLHTCEAVLSEAFHLLEPVPMGPERLLAVLRRGVFNLSFSYAQNAGRVRELMRAYADRPMSFADAGLVCLAELHPASRIFTTDNDFHVYRKASDRPLDVLAPRSR